MLIVAAPGGLPITPCISVRLRVESTVACSRRRIRRFGMRLFRFRDGRDMACGDRSRRGRAQSSVSSSAKARIQYSRGRSSYRRGRGVLDAPPSRGMTACGETALRKARSGCARDDDAFSAAVASSSQASSLVERRPHLALHARVIVVEPVQLVLAQHALTSISRRSIGASVSVSNAFIGFSAPAMSAADHQLEVLDPDAEGVGLVVAGLVGQDHAALQRRGAELGDPRRAFVHREIAADAVAGAVVEIEAGLPQRIAAPAYRAARRWCRRETPRARSRCGRAARG